MTSFDAHQYAKRLIDAGSSAAEADVHADALGQVAGELASLETRVETQCCKSECSEQRIIAHVDKVTAHVDKTMAEFREYVNGRLSEQNEKIAALKWEILRWTIGIVLGVASLQAGVTAAMLHWMR